MIRGVDSTGRARRFGGREPRVTERLERQGGFRRVDSLVDGVIVP